MSIDGIVTGSNLGDEFDQGNIAANEIRLKIGAGLTRAADGTISSTGGTGTLAVSTLPLYEYREIWAEENGGIDDNAEEWSMGGGDNGRLGIPWGNDWEIIETYLHADANGGAGNESLTVNILDIQGAASPVIAVIEIIGPGQGQNNNAWVLNQVNITTPDGFVPAFRTDDEVGTWAGVRVGFRARRQVGTYVSGVALV